jgi:hypothetical protein
VVHREIPKGAELTAGTKIEGRMRLVNPNFVRSQRGIGAAGALNTNRAYCAGSTHFVEVAAPNGERHVQILVQFPHEMTFERRKSKLDNQQPGQLASEFYDYA